MKWKRFRIVSALVMLVLAAFGAWRLWTIMEFVSAYYAKRACTGVFLARRALDDVLADVRADMTRGFSRFSASVDQEQGIAEASLFGFAGKRALYREGLGCTLVNAVTVDALRAQTNGLALQAPPADTAAPWPEGGRVDTAEASGGIDASALAAALDNAFAEPQEDALRRTRAVVVVWRGRIVAERYAEGVTAQTTLPGWSMGKSVASALTGILVGEGKLKLDQKELYPEWRGDDDPRSRITPDDLLRMTSGLDFDKPQGGILTDVRRMLFLEGDAAAYARARPAIGAPGETWIYGSGSSILVSYLWRRVEGGGLASQFGFPRRALFAPLGMTSAVIEPDASGTLLAAAFTHATARDWARFGLFLLRDGVWQGRRILPEGWMERSLKPTPASGGVYAAHFWRRVPDFLRPDNAPARELPRDRYYMLGHNGQMTAIVPSRDLVIVRLGVSKRRGAFDPDALLADVLRSLPGG